MRINRTINRNLNGQPLSDEQIQKYAPSAFAGQAHDSRSNRYAFIPTSDVISGLRNSGFHPVQASQSTSRVEGKEFFTKHLLRFRPADTQLTQVGDTAVEAVLTNSHDGTSCYEISLGAFRLACLNGMMVSNGLVESIKVRHTGNIIERVVEVTQAILSKAPMVTDAIRQWKSILLSWDEQILLAQSALNLRFDGQSPIDANKVLTVNRYSDQTNDLWTIFNRIQENVIRGGLRFVQPSRTEPTGQYVPARRAQTREVRGIDQNTRLNRELWTLAEKMAELKTR